MDRVIIIHKASDFRLNAPRQERNFDYVNSEEYKKKHNLQKTKHYDISPSNTGEKYPVGLNNSFNDADRDVGNLI